MGYVPSGVWVYGYTEAQAYSWYICPLYSFLSSWSIIVDKKKN